MNKARSLNTASSQFYLQAMALPAVIWMVIFQYIPMVGAFMSFTNYSIFKPFSLGPFVGFQHFIDFFNDAEFSKVVINTLGLSLYKMVVCFPSPIILALLFNELRKDKFKRVIQTISYLPHFLSWIILGGILITWLSDTGLVTTLLVKLGILRDNVYLLGEPQYFWSVAVISDLWKEIGFSSIIYIAAITSLDMEIYESAEIDGASRLGKMWYITLPGISDTILLLLILNIANIFGSNFDQIFVLYNPANIDRSQGIDLFVYRKAFSVSNGQFSFSAAAGLVRSIISALLLFTANSFSKKVLGKSAF